MKGFLENLKRIHRANGRPVDVKLPDSIDESKGGQPQDTCADCGESAKSILPFISYIVEDALGNERVVCSKCWKENHRP